MKYEQNGEYDKAKEIYLELYKQNPNDFVAVSYLNRTLLASKEYDLLKNILEERKKVSPSDYNIYGMLGNVYYIKGEIKKGVELWKEGIAVQPKSIPAYRVIASYAVQNRAYETAVEFYKTGEKEFNQKDLFINEKYNLYNAQQKYTEAAETVCEAILSQPGYIGLGKSIVYSISDRENICSKYIEVIERYYAQTRQKVFKEFLAFIYQALGKNDKAVTLIKEVDAEEKNGNSVMVFAQECFGARNYEAASEAYKYLTDTYKNIPSMISAWLYYPRCLEYRIKEKEETPFRHKTEADTAGFAEYGRVINAYYNIAGNYPNTDYKNEALLRIGNIKKEILRDYEGAEKAYAEIIAGRIYSVNRVSAVENLAGLKLFYNKFDEAFKLLEEIINGSTADAASKKKARFYLGKYYYWRGEFDEALKNINEAAEDYSGDFSNDALELSAVITSCKKDTVRLRSYAAADYLIFRKQYSQAADTLKGLIKSENEILSEAAEFDYGEILANLGKYEDAVKIMKEISARSNSNYADNAYFSLGNIFYYGINDSRGAKECFEKLLADYPGSIYADKAREMINTIKNKLETEK